MAIVFISPKKRQKMFFMAIAGGLGVFMLIVTLWVFLSKAPESSQQMQMVFNKPKVVINFDIFDSEEFKKLEPLEKIQTQFSYKAIKDGKTPIEGIISAPSEEEANTILTGMGYEVKEIKEIQTGRENPFTPYYETVTNQNQ